MEFDVEGGGDKATLTATCVSIGGQSFYIVRIPFETRSVGIQKFQKTANTLAFTTGYSSYNRTVTVNGNTVI